MLKSFLLFGAAIVALTSAARAQSESDLAVPPESVVVTATRIATPLDQVGSSVTVIDAADIAARQQRSLPDVLRDVPGLNIVQVGGEGGQASLFLRGGNSNHTKVLVDGIDVADPSNPIGAYDFGKFNSADIARVEVLRGPQSGLYGSDAIGGVINIITKSGNGPLSLAAEAEGGSFDTFNQSATISGSQDAFHYRATLAHLHAGATPVTPLDLLPPGQKRNDDYFDNLTASTKLGYDVAENFDLGFSGRASNSLSRVTGDAFDPNTFASFPSPLQTRIDTLSYAARGTAHLTLGPAEQTLGLSYSSTVTSDMDPNNGSIPSSGDRIKLDWQGQAQILDGEVIVLGAETGRDAIHIPLSAGVTTNAGFGELQSSMTDLFGLSVDFHNSVSVRYDDNSRFGSKTTWHVAPVLALKETGTRLHASYGTGFKAPSLEQLFLSFPAFFFFANPNLKPETSAGYDVGVDQSFGAVTGGITWYHNNIKNLIETDPVTFSTDVNIGRARTEGIEAYLAWQAFDTLKLRADYTYTEAQDADLHQELVRRPKDKFSASASWQALEALNLNADLLYVGSWIDGSRDFSVSRLNAHPYWTLDLAASYALTETWALTGRVNNLLDKRYENPVGFQGPGIGAYAGVKASF
ncbi:MAG TPA: TonB-dependent receptor [Rhizomicrobium sp.]|jgi:vitamin B12 transporter|nr:TonB-dependent receptor [Rhizomicrobium sp.]